MGDEAAPAPATPAARLLAAPEPAARARAHAIAAADGRVLTIIHADAIAAESDPAEAMRRVLRDATCYTERRIARVFEGRIVASRHLTPPTPAGGLPPARIALTLAAEEDTRVLHLEGAWAWNLAATGARAGDIVQVARDAPFVTLRADRSATEGRVLDERDHLLRVRLGAIDQAHTQALSPAPLPSPAAPDSEPQTERGAPEHAESEDAVLLRAARMPEEILGTGERPPTGPAARVRTDHWLRRRLATVRAALEPGVLLVTCAASLPPAAAATLRAALAAPAHPEILLADKAEEPAAETRRRFPEAIPA